MASTVDVSIDDFRARFPEFARASDTLVGTFLIDAEDDVDADVWGAKAAKGVMYLAAHRLAVSPFGQTARLSATDGRTTYLGEYERLLAMVASGYRVI